MGIIFRKIFTALVVAGQLGFASVRRSFAQEADRFKNPTGQKDAMAPPVVKEKAFSPEQVRATAEQWMKADRDDVPKKIRDLSLYQRGQLATYCLYLFYRLPPDQRRTSDPKKNVYGNELYFLISQLYPHQEEESFRNGAADADLQRQLRGQPAFGDFVTLWKSRYQEYISRETRNQRAPVAFLDYLLAGYDQSVPPSRIVPTRIDWLDSVPDKTLDEFIRSLNVVGIPAGANRVQKLKGLTAAFKRFFSYSEDEQAEQAARAMIDAYKLTPKDQQAAFLKWAKTDGKDRLATELGTIFTHQQTEPTPEEAVRTMFREWKQAQEEEELAEAQEEAELAKDYLPHIRNKRMPVFLANFERIPGSEAVDDIEQRLEYVQKYRRVLENKGQQKGKEYAELGKELDVLKEWLDKLGLDPSKAKEYFKQINLPADSFAKTVPNQLAMLKTGIAMLQMDYTSMHSKNLRLVDDLKSLQKSNATLYDIYKRYVIALDGQVGRLFQGLKPNASDFPDQVGKVITDKLDEQTMRQGQGLWSGEYYLLGMKTFNRQDPVFQRAYARIGELDPLAAHAFSEYVEAAKRAHLSSEREKKLVVDTVARLNALSEVGGPLLVAKYLYTIEHLADVCYGNQAAFTAGLEAMNAQVVSLTAPVFRPVRSIQNLPVAIRTRQAMSNIAAAFDQIMLIDRGSLARYMRYHVIDDTLTLHTDPPHTIEQKAPAWKGPPLVDERRGAAFFAESPFLPYQRVAPTFTLIGVGGVTNAYYGGAVSLLSPTYADVPGQTEATFGQRDRYKFAGHPRPDVYPYLPGVTITPLNATELLNRINRAFIPSGPMPYVKKVVGFGAGVGGTVVKQGEETTGALGGLVSVAYPTGGWSAGGAKVFEGGSMVGATAMGVPIGKWNGKESAVDSFAGGYDTLDPETRRLLVQGLSTQYDPNNPSQIILAVNREETTIKPEGEQMGEETTDMPKGKKMAWSSARYFFIEKDGTIMDARGGTNDFVEMLNFVALYGDLVRDQPATFAGNYEPLIKRGGGVIAFDVGKTAWQLHAQAVPFLAEEGEPQPLLLQWTPAMAVTTEQPAKDKTTVTQVSLPGAALVMDATILRPLGEGERPPPGTTPGGEVPQRLDERYRRQDLAVKVRQLWREGQTTEQGESLEEVWEWDFGVGAADVTRRVREEGAEATTEEETVRRYGRGGAFLKFQKPDVRYGGGAYYEPGATQFEALALLQEEEQAREYVKALHRIGLTLYGSREAAGKTVMGGLAHALPQWLEKEKLLEGGEVERKKQFDHLFYRAVGFLGGAREIGELNSPWALAGEISRVGGVDRLVTEYNSILAQIGEDPTNAAGLLDDFRDQYGAAIQDAFNNYYLGVTLTKDFSLEFNLTSREEFKEGQSEVESWKGQKLETVYARTLYTWNSNFVRAFVSAPVYEPVGLAGEQTTGVIGVGTGIDLFNGLWFQRAVADVGMLIAFHEQTEEWTGFPPTAEQLKKFENIFAQGVLDIFSNVARDSARYRRLENRYKDYLEAVQKGNFGAVPREVREAMVRHMRPRKVEGEEVPGMLPEPLLEKIERGELLTTLKEEPVRAIENGLWAWFYDEKVKIEKDFSGHLDVDVAGAGYFFNDRTLWDIGAFVEHVDLNIKAYGILSRRILDKEREGLEPKKVERYTAFAGADWQLTPRLVLGAIGGVTLKGPREAGGALSVRYRIRRFPWTGLTGELGIIGFGRSSSPPVYANPAYAPIEEGATPEFGGLFILTLGSGMDILQAYPGGTPAPGMGGQGPGGY